MKYLLRAVLLMCVVAFMLMDKGFSETVPDRTCLKIVSGGNLADTETVIQACRNADTLWPDSPEGYFQVVQQAMQALAGAPDNPAAKQCLSNLFVSVSEKKMPGNNTKQNTVYFEQKGKAYISFLGLGKTREDKSRLLAIALFVGEMRSRIIPSYANRGTSRPGLNILEQAGVNDRCALTNAVLIEAYERAIKANEEDMLMNELQLMLLRNDRIITFHLLHACARLSGADSVSKKFINSIIKHARLTEKEVKKLWSEEGDILSKRIDAELLDGTAASLDQLPAAISAKLEHMAARVVPYIEFSGIDPKEVIRFIVRKPRPKHMIRLGLVSDHQDRKPDPTWLDDLQLGSDKVSCTLTNASLLDLSMIFSESLNCEFGVASSGEAIFRNRTQQAKTKHPAYILKRKSIESR